METGPGEGFPSVTKVKRTAVFGWQSTRNPANIAEPPPAQPELGNDGRLWAWGFVLTGESGYLPFDHLERWPDYAGPFLDGPAGAGFEAGRQEPSHGYNSPCGERVAGRRVVRKQTVYLRYGPESTPFGYLLLGDVVSLRCSGPHSTYCGRVVRSSSVKPGTVGWFEQESVRPQL
jgi:hypothetical protein